MSDFDKLLEEELEKQKKKKKKQQTTSASNLIGNSFSYLPSYTSPAQDIASRLTGIDESDIAPLISRGLREEILAPTKSKEDDSKLDFFQKGAFSDGYQFGDVTKSILGTVGDAGLGITKGLLGLSEGVGDLVTYGIAGVADAFGFEDDADRFKRNAQKNATDELFRGATNYLDQYSVLGRTSDAVLQGIGQVGGIMATGGIGAAAGLGTAGATALTTGVIGLSGMGSGIGEAYQGGATDGEALAYGAISGTADALTELLFGGLGKAVNAVGLSKGISSVDDMLAKKVSGLFKTHIAKNISEFGIKAGAEGFEEVLAGIAQGIGKKITYADDKELSEIMKDENLLEQFIVAVVTSGIAQAPGLHIANKTNTDFITGQTQQEQDVLKKVVEQRIAELEAEGKTLTKKQQGEIEADVLEQMEKGYISTETIEEVLGGDNYTAYQDTIKQENEALAELAELYEGEELKQRAEEFLNNSKRSEMAKTLSDSVYDMVKDTRLGESYRDRARRGQKFEADVTQYDEKQRAIVQKAIDSGVLNNTNRTHDMVDFIARVSADTGVLFDFTNNEKLKDSIFAVNGKTVDGYITKDGITINVNSPRYINTIVGHEITHALEGTELYETLETALFEYAKEKGNYKDVLKDAYEMYSGEEGYQGYEGLKKIKKEAVANLVGDYLFTDKNFVNHLSAKHQNIFQKVWNEVKYMVKIARAGSNEAKKLLEVQKAFEEAYRNGGKTVAETKHSLSPVEAVQPKSEGWHRTATTEEAMAKFPNMWNVAAEESEVRNPTQIRTTVKTYRNIYDILKSEGFNGTILDASSGLGDGTKAGIEEYGFNVEDIEPYPDKGYNPKYQDYSTLDKKYDVIISNAVLNVLPQDQRDALVVKMGELLNDGGRMFINVRGKDVESLAKTGKNIHLGKMEWIETVKGSYQKGFTTDELKAYLEDALGKGYTVDKTSKFGGVSVIVTKDGGVKYSLSKDSDGKKQSFSNDVESITYNGKDFYEAVVNGRTGEILHAWTENEQGSSDDYFAIMAEVEDKVGEDGYFFVNTDLLTDDYKVMYDSYGNEIDKEVAGRINAQLTVNYKDKAPFPLDDPRKTNLPTELPTTKELREGFNNAIEFANKITFEEAYAKNGIDWVVEDLLLDHGVEYSSNEPFHRMIDKWEAELEEQGLEGYEVEEEVSKRLADVVRDVVGETKYSLSDSKKLKDVGLDYDAKNETVSYSLSSLEDAFDYNKSEADYLASRLEYETALAKSIAEDKDNVTEEEMAKAKRYLDSLFLIHDMIAMDKERLDYEAAVGKSAWVSNAEYGGSIDFSTLCAKRRLFTGTFDAIQNELPDTVLDENDFLQIRNLLLEKELESPCSMCYVEGSRAKHGVYVAKFLKEYKQTNPEWMPQIADFTSTTRLEQTRINHPEAYQAYVDAMNKLSQRKPKEASVRTDYRGEILRDFKDTSTVAEKNKNGGVRFNSFSDFEIIHAIDCMQVLTDMARVGLNGQAYTKVKEFAEAFGNTGLKINLSLVAKDVDANGKLIMDETNGMKYDEAMDLRNRYSENVGTVIVVFNEAQLRAALADSTIDYVLPFHRSQWRKSQYTMMGLPTSTKDFTNYQNDRIKNPNSGRDVKLSKIKHISEYTNDITGETFEIKDNIMPNQYWDFNLDGRGNAQRYLDYINANGMTPKFNFLLDKVDGKWVLPEGAVGDGYFKVLIDFKMYNNDGWGSPQNPVVPEFNMPFIQQMLENYKGGHQAFPVAHDVVSEFVEGKKSGKFSLSNDDTHPTKQGNWHISGKDVAYEEIAPVAQTMAETKQPVSQTKFVADEPAEELFPDDREELTNLLSHQFELRGALESAVSMGDTNTMSMLTQEYEDVTARIRELEAQESERLDSIDDADAPPEMETQHDEVADTTPLNKKTVTDLTKKVKPLLGLKNNRTGELVSVIEAYSRSENASSEQLFNELKEKFGKFTEKTVDEPTKEVKALLRGYKINVSDSIKSEIADYGDLMRRNFGRVRFSKEGMNVDEVYEDLSAGYPGYFPEDIINPTDQLMQIIHVANMEAETVSDMEVDDDSLVDAARTIARTVRAYKQSQMQELSNREARESFDSLMKSADKYAPADDIAPVKQKEKTAKIEKPAIAPEGKIKTVKERLTAKMQDLETELANNRKLREESWADYDSEIARAQAEYNAKGNKNTVAANDLLRRIERLNRMKHNTDADYAKRISDLEARTAKVAEEVRTGQSNSEQGAMRQELHGRIMSDIRTSFDESGYDFDNVLRNAKNLSTFATVDNTPQRVMEKALGYKQGQILSNLTVNKVAQNETEGIKWLNNFTDRKDGVLAKLSKQYHIKPGSKESAAAQMYAEGFYVNGKNEIVQYGDAELAQDFPNAKVRANIKGLARDPRIRQIYDGTLDKINESRTRNAYPEIQKLDNYFLHFRAMDDTFSKLGIPFNPNDIKAKDLPTDLNGVTADLKPGQPYFASAMHRTGKRTSFDLLGGLERYLSSAKNQIYHIDDIQTLRALRNYVADTYGQAHGLESLDLLTEEEAQERIDKVYGSHLSTFAKFLNEEANIIAGKTALIDRGLEGIIGRRGITFLNTVNKQVGSNMVGFNVSSSLTNFLPVAQTLAKTNKFDFVKAFAQTVSNKVGSVFGKGDGFAENSPVFIRRKGEERFYRTPWQKAADAGYMLMGAVDDISTELIARTKYNELTRKGMDSKQAHYETDKWVSRLMGDRSLGQQPQLYNSKMLGMITKFQLEVRNQLDAQFYDTIQEEKASNEHIQNGLLRNAKTAAKVGSTFFQLAVVQHLFGKAFESIAGYNPAFDIISVLIKAFGWDDDEDDEDTVLDNIEEGFLELMGDLPYTSTMTGGRIPISSALPVKQFVTGKDQYGNEKSRWETLAEAAPYYVLPGGYGQAKKTYQGLSMFDDEHPVAGSYTNSGNLRFPVEDTLGNRVQAGLFGQYASENARDYFDNERSPLKPNQIQEYIDVDLPIREYWDYREGLSEHPTLDAKGDYIGGLDLPVGKKNILINNIAKREEPIDMANYAKYPNFKEFDWAEQNEEKYAFLQDHGMSYADYEKLDEDSKKAYTWAYNNPEKYAFVKEQGLSAVEYNALDDDTKDAYSWAYENPEMYTVSKAVSSDFLTYYQYRTDLGKLDAKNEKGESVSGLKKERVIDYINGLDIDYGQKIILFRSMYDGKADQEAYNGDIVDYLNSRDDLSYSEMVTILKKLGFTVSQNGTVTW